MTKNITVRTEHAKAYPVIGWIVTGSIWPKPCRLFVKLSDAKRYAVDICKEVNEQFGTPAYPAVEWRTSTNGLRLEADYSKEASAK